MNQTEVRIVERAGDPPHLGSTMQAIISKVLTETPAPVSHTRDLVPPKMAGPENKKIIVPGVLLVTFGLLIGYGAFLG